MLKPKDAVRLSLIALAAAQAVFAWKLGDNGPLFGPVWFWTVWFATSALLCFVAFVRPVRGWAIPFAGAFSTLAFLSRAAGCLYHNELLSNWPVTATAWALIAVLTFVICVVIARTVGGG